MTEVANNMVAALWSKASALDAEAAQARKDDGMPYVHWLGERGTQMAQQRFSTLHMCANVWRAAAVMAETGS